jgi:hypothetical protein
MGTEIGGVSDAPVAIMGSQSRILSSGANLRGSLFRYMLGCTHRYL